MFDIGWGELVVIGIVALIAIGPKELPGVLRTLGQTMGKIRRMAAEFQGQFQEALREAEMADLKKHAEDIKSSVTDIASFDPMASTQKDIERSFESIGSPSEAPKESAPTALPEPAQQVDLNVPLPEPQSPVSEGDFAPSEAPSPKQAGGGA